MESSATTPCRILESGTLPYRAAVVGVAVILALEVAVALGIHDPHFRIAFAVVWVAMAARRMWFRENGRLFLETMPGEKGSYPFSGIILSASIPWMVLPALSGISASGPEWFAPVVMGMPVWLRWAGLAIGIASISSPFLMIRPSTASLWTEDGSAILSLFLLSANWLVGFLGMAGLSLVLWQRVTSPKLCRQPVVPVVG
jgi:hypothetical protein